MYSEQPFAILRCFIVTLKCICMVHCKEELISTKFYKHKHYTKHIFFKLFSYNQVIYKSYCIWVLTLGQLITFIRAGSQGCRVEEHREKCDTIWGALNVPYKQNTEIPKQKNIYTSVIDQLSFHPDKISTQLEVICSYWSIANAHCGVIYLLCSKGLIFVLLLRQSVLCYPTWILKGDRLESSGLRLISLNRKSKRISIIK